MTNSAIFNSYNLLKKTVFFTNLLYRICL